VANYNLQAQVTLVAALVTANANPATLLQTQIELDALQQQLVASLMAAGNLRPPGTGNATNKPSFLTASGVLSACTINS
jgi:hypothetical protein